MKSKNRKVAWCLQEDQLVLQFVRKNGPCKWSLMADQLYQHFGDFKKTGKQCRQRWYNHLDPSLVKKNWTIEEQDLLFQQHKRIGNKWTTISQKLQGRSDNCIKNHFYSTIRKSLRRINKFLGSKQGTTIVRKIKPVALSKICVLIEKCSQSQLPQKEQNYGQFLKCKQSAYNLINFSRWKLSDHKCQITNQDKQRFQKILTQINKINDEMQSKNLSPQNIQKQSVNIKNIPIQPLYPVKVSSNIQIMYQNQNSQINIYFDTFDNQQACKILPSVKIQFKTVDISVEQFAHKNSKIQQNLLYPQQNIHNNFEFNIQLDQQISQIHKLQMPAWLNITPYIITPSSRKNKKQLPIPIQSHYNTQYFNQLTDKIINQIKINTNNEVTNGLCQQQSSINIDNLL